MIRLGHDLHQGHAGAVQVNKAVAPLLMDIFARVLFHMDACNTDPLHFTVNHDLDIPVFADRQLVLAYLIALRKVGVEIVLPREPAVGG